MTIIKTLCFDIEKAVHFAVPDNGFILNDNKKGIINSDINLPYDLFTIEYYEEIINTKVVILVKKTSNDNIDLLPIVTSKILTFFPYHTCSSIPTKSPVYIESGNVRFKISEFVFLPDCGTDEFLKEKYVSYYSAISVSVLLEFIEALACSNVEITTHQTESPKNKQRIKSHKLPIYETKILTIKPSISSNKHITIGSHASPRQHLRRGHIRRLESGNIWVNSCVVGNVENGRIDKQYRVDL